MSNENLNSMLSEVRQILIFLFYLRVKRCNWASEYSSLSGASTLGVGGGWAPGAFLGSATEVILLFMCTVS